MSERKVLLSFVAVLLLLTTATTAAVAASVTRSITPDTVVPEGEVTVELVAEGVGIGVQIVETIPEGFTVVDWGYSGADNVDFQQSDNVLTFTVTDVSGDGFTITYTLQAPSTGGTYTFSGTYEPMGQEVQDIGGESTVVVAAEEAPPEEEQPPAEEVTAPTPNDGPISIPELNIDMVKLSDDEINVGETIEISAVWGKLDDSTRRIVVIEWTDYQEVNGDVSKLLDKAKAYWTLSETSGDATYTFSPEEPGYYYVVVYGVAPNVPLTINDELVFRAKPAVAGKPTVSITVDKSEVAMGDYIKVKASMSSDVPVKVIKIFVTGSGYFLTESGASQTTALLCYYSGDGVYKVDEACGDDTWWVPIPEIPEGVYVAKIDVGEGPTRAEAVALFSVVKPKILSLDVPAQHVKGTDLVIEGTTNLAKSGTNNDNATLAPEIENMATLKIEDLAGNVIVDSTMTAAAKSYIDEGGKFRFKLDNFGTKFLNQELDTGYYKVTVTIFSGVKTAEETATFELVKAELKLTADKTTVARGDDVKFTIDTNLKVNNPVVFKIEDTDFCTGDPDCVAEKTYYVDVKGDVTITLTVNTLADLTDYKFTAEIPDLGISDEVRVAVVKQVLNISAKETTVARGGSVEFTGTTSADVVYVYANEQGVFKIGDEWVAELPSDTVLDTANELDTAVVYPDSNDALDFKIKAIVTSPEYGDVSPGTYYLYFFAPADVTDGVANKIDRSADTQAVIAITVTDPKIVSVDIPSRIPYQGAVEVSILTEPGDRNNVEVTFKLEGSNIKARPSDFKLPTYQKPDANNYVNFTLDLKKYMEENGDTIEPGLYVFVVKLRFVDSLGGDEVDEKESLVEVVPQTLDVTIEPEKPVSGEKIKLTISTNREGKSGYDHIWVTLVGPNYKAVQRVALDSAGKGTVTFETVGLAAGTYKFYIRDTAGTIDQIDEIKLAEDLYDLDPAEPIAKVYNAHDDLLVTRTIEILEAAAPTTPTETTTTTTVTTTTTTVATTTTTTTTVVTTPTTTTPQQGGGVPGFEAVFAIAGLLAVAYLLRRK